jgi:hypothetical protein
MAEDALLGGIVGSEQFNAVIGTISYYANLVSGTNDPLVRFFFLSIGLAIFGAFVYFSFMRISRRDIVSFSVRKRVLKAAQPTLADFMIYVLKYMLVFPLLTLLWTAVMAGILLMLSKQPNVGYAVLFATVIIGATRILAYFSEPAAQEIAKLLPLVFLSVLLFDPNVSFLNGAPKDMGVLLGTLPQVEAYVAGIVLLEIALRLLYTVRCLALPKLSPSMDEELGSALDREKKK